MNKKALSTDSYKGVRDFYPEDMAVQRYIFDTWSKTAESFGFQRYDASILEPSDLYRAKGAENEEMVNEQTYTFTDRGEREVTLRPEMTPTVARLIARKAQALSFPVRWYSIPNLFRYERPQKGRLREHWQLNCDLFGATHYSADVEIIALAHQLLLDFGATPDMFEIRINSRKVFVDFLKSVGDSVGLELSEETCLDILRLRDRQDKMQPEEYVKQLEKVIGSQEAYQIFAEQLHQRDNVTTFDSDGLDDLELVGKGLLALGITNIKRDSKISRGFDYYTGIVFEIFELDEHKKYTGRAMLGGGRYDNLTAMFGGTPVSGIGFGMGDVTMRDFLEEHKLLPENIKSTGTHVTVIPQTAEENLAAQSIAHRIRQAGFSVSTDIGTRKVQKKFTDAKDKSTKFSIIIGADEVKTGSITIKNLSSNQEETGQLAELMNFLSVA